MSFLTHMLKQHKNYVIVILGVLILIAIYLSSQSQASFAPGTELDPNCEPGDVGCTVDAGGGVSIGDAVGSGTNGSVLFVDALGNLGPKNSHFFIDTLNNYLGIGTSAPTAKLHVADSSTSAIFRIDASGNGGSADAVVVDDVGNVGIGTTSPSAALEIASGVGVDGLKINSTFIVDDNGNVGIGTTSPDYRLTLDNPSSTFMNWKIGGTNKVEFGVGSISATKLALTNVSSNMMVWDLTNGNVGIGTTSPGDLLDISGAGYDGTNWDVVIRGGSAGTGVGLTLNNTTDSVKYSLVSRQTGAFGLYDHTLGGYGLNYDRTAFGTLIIAGNSAVGTGLEFSPSGAGGQVYDVFSTANSSGPGGGKFAIYHPGSSSYRMIIDSSGKVGFGTDSPGAKTHIVSTTEQLRLGYDASNYLKTTVSSAGIADINSSGQIINFTGPGSGMYVGINLASPASIAATLDIFHSGSNPLIRGIEANTHAEMNLQATNNTKSAFYRAYDDGSNSLNVGILNTSYPTSGVFVPGATFMQSVSSAGSPLLLVNENATGFISLVTGGSGTANERMRIDSSGNVGIGNTDPESTLQIGETEDTTYQYLQYDYETSAPASADCDSDTEGGRVILVNDTVNLIEYGCAGSDGWRLLGADPI